MEINIKTAFNVGDKVFPVEEKPEGHYYGACMEFFQLPPTKVTDIICKAVCKKDSTTIKIFYKLESRAFDSFSENEVFKTEKEAKEYVDLQNNL